MENALIIAKQNDFDVFNALDIMDNAEFLKVRCIFKKIYIPETNASNLLQDLKFQAGDGNLHYYLYNWRLSKDLEPKELGMVLV